MAPPARAAVGDGFRQAGAALGFDVRPFVNSSHRRVMAQRYPRRSEAEIIGIYNGYVRDKGFHVENPPAHLMDWLKLSAWLNTPAGHA